MTLDDGVTALYVGGCIAVSAIYFVNTELVPTMSNIDMSVCDHFMIYSNESYGTLTRPSTKYQLQFHNFVSRIIEI